MNINIEHLFTIKSEQEFRRLALDVFRFQATNNPIYGQYVQSLKIDIEAIEQIEQIPFLPVEFFKSFEIITNNQNTNNPQTFTSSGTTGQITSKHFVSDSSIYQKVI
jgi:phenylacetate-coenzyme A ligase PaaK-like adenylate-forming protein